MNRKCGNSKCCWISPYELYHLFEKLATKAKEKKPSQFAQWQQQRQFHTQCLPWPVANTISYFAFNCTCSLLLFFLDCIHYRWLVNLRQCHSLQKIHIQFAHSPVHAQGMWPFNSISLKMNEWRKNIVLHEFSCLCSVRILIGLVFSHLLARSLSILRNVH